MISANELQQDNMEKQAAINQHIDLIHKAARTFIEETSFLADYNNIIDRKLTKNILDAQKSGNGGLKNELTCNICPNSADSWINYGNYYLTSGLICKIYKKYLPDFCRKHHLEQAKIMRRSKMHPLSLLINQTFFDDVNEAIEKYWTDYFYRLNYHYNFITGVLIWDNNEPILDDWPLI